MKFYSYTFFILFSFGMSYGRICPSTVVQNSIDAFQELKGCEIIEGYLYIILNTKINEPNLNQLSFPLLKEITCHLIFYRVKGFTSLRKLFPNLSVIRGEELFSNYALIIFEMDSLIELGLNSLSVIQRGSVIILKNPKLCFVNSINWTLITQLGEHNFFAQNQNPELCGMCATNCVNCWSENENDCQIIKGDDNCDKNCLEGCTGAGPENCKVCKRIVHENKCMEFCPDNLLELHGRRCVSKEQCKKTIKLDHQKHIIKYKQFNNMCIDICPPPRNRDSFILNDNSSTCSKNRICDSALINSLETAQNLKGCKVIYGSLKIVNIPGGSNTIKEIRYYLGSIENITGSLKISRCESLTSLDILPRLTIIGGEALEWSTYAVVINENPALSQLWPKGSKPKILRGRIFVQNNVKLCPSKIEEFVLHAGIAKPNGVEILNNGEARKCYDIILETSESKPHPETVIIHWKPNSKLKPSSEFAIFYIEVTSGDTKSFKNCYPCLLEVCGSKEWQFIKVHGNGTYSQILTYLKPYTWYAYYVTTYPFTNVGARSEVSTFLTLPSQPSRPRNLKWIINDQGVKLRWDIPSRPNGLIEHYLVTPVFLPEDLHFLSLRNFCYSFLEENKEHVESFSYNENNRNYIQNQYDNEYHEDTVDMKSREHFDTFLDTILIKNNKEKGIELTSHFPEKNIELNYYYGEEESKETIQVTGNEFSLKLLQPYGRYVIRVAACRRRIQGEEAANTPLCSIASYVTIRTKQDKNQDIVTRLLITQTNKDRLRVSWQEPEIANGAVVAFNLQVILKRDNGGGGHDERNDALDWPYCIPRQQWLDQGRSLDLPTLPVGLYQIRVRAISLAGPGPFTDWLEWKQSHSLDWTYILIILLLISIIILICIFLIKMKCRRSRNEDRIRLLNSIHNSANETITFY